MPWLLTRDCGAVSAVEPTPLESNRAAVSCGSKPSYDDDDDDDDEGDSSSILFGSDGDDDEPDLSDI